VFGAAGWFVTDVSLVMPMMSNTSLEPMPVTPGRFRCRFPLGECHWRHGPVLGRAVGTRASPLGRE
jgi:hypothetical protein